MKVYLIAVTFLFINLFDSVRPDALSLSITGMETLIAKDTLFIKNMQLYLNELEKKAEVIRNNLNRMRAENEKAISEGDDYLMNPLQAFALLRRTYADWIYWEYYMQKRVGDEYVNNIINERKTNPTDEDFHEAVDGIYRLQRTYGLNPIDMAVGKLNELQYNTRLSAMDCLSISYYFYERESNAEVDLWLHSAINQFKDDDSLFEIFPISFKAILNFRTENLAKLAYKRGCRGEFRRRDPKLHCVYNTTTDPFLKLAPLKMEEINLDPYVVLYHDVISDVEIGVLKNVAMPRLERAGVVLDDNSATPKIRVRTSKVAWLPDNTNAVTRRVNQRVADMTGFTMRGAENIQMMNYGLGGHHDVHNDFFDVPENHELVANYGNRIATAMFYLSDVEQGGETIFPNIELAVFPKKGTCIVWYNLNTKGEGDLNMLHAACPVIVGSKWLAIKWIREREQAFRRLCLPE